MALLLLQPPCLSPQMRTELYFLSSQKNRPSLFGMPLIVPCTVHTTKKDLYDAVWIQVSRLASPLPPQEASNHAQDWYAPLPPCFFRVLKVSLAQLTRLCLTLQRRQHGLPVPLHPPGRRERWERVCLVSVVQVGRALQSCTRYQTPRWCAHTRLCDCSRFCRGCLIECSDDRASLGNAYIAVDWDPTALHLRYQTSQERVKTHTVGGICLVKEFIRLQRWQHTGDLEGSAFSGPLKPGPNQDFISQIAQVLFQETCFSAAD